MGTAYFDQCQKEVRRGTYWVNVDKPLKRCPLHAPGCTYAMQKAETAFKGLGRMKRDGGWLPVDSPAAAERYGRTAFPKLVFKKCGICRP